MTSYNFSLTDLDSDMFSCGYFYHEDVCRFCWTRDATIEIFPKNTPPREDKPLADKIVDCLNIDIHTPSQPNRVCDSCANHIETFYSFKKFCTESDKKLNELFENRIPTLDVTVKVEDVPNSNENSLEESAIQNENCSQDVLQNDQTQITQNTVQSEDHTYCQNSDNRNEYEDNSESEDMTLVLSEDEICHDEQSTTNMEDSFVDVDNVLPEQDSANIIEETEQNDEKNEILKPKDDIVIVEIEREMDSLDRLLSKIHGEDFTSDCDIIAKEINSKEIKTKELRKRKIRSKTSKKENLIETVTPKRSKRKEETKPNELKEFCKTCSKDFPNIHELAKHNNKVHKMKDNGKSFMCYGCEKSFETKKRRFNHELRYCKGLKDGYKCPKCDTNLQYRKLLERHVKDHKLRKNVNMPEIFFKCKICEKSFKTKEKLITHRNRNHPRKNYICETCGRVFTRPDYLHKHKLTHTDIRDHKCPSCPYSTVQRSSLVIHMRTHTGDRPYACDKCTQRCVTKSNLNAHMRSHLGIRKHECQLCPKRFAYKTSLVYHIAHCHDRPLQFICHYCQATYCRKDGLRRHIRTKHNVINNRPANLNMDLEHGLFVNDLPPVLQNIDYGEFSKFEEGFNEKIRLQI